MSDAQHRSDWAEQPDGDERLDAESATIELDLMLKDSTFQNCMTFLKSLKIGGDAWDRGGEIYRG